MTSMSLALIVPAAGASNRYSQSGGLRNKLDEDLGGRPVLQRTIELFVKHETLGPVLSGVVVAGPHDPETFREFMEKYGDRLGLLGAKAVRGGKSHRYESVREALALVPATCTHIAVHDAARPCTPPELLDRVFDAAQHHDAVIPVIGIHDTLKRIVSTEEAAAPDDPISAILGETSMSRDRLRIVEETIPRDRVHAAQTPQLFRAELLRRAYAQPNLESTDDAGLVERIGARVAVVDGDARNIKITHAGDLTLARAILGLKPPEGRAAHKRF